MKTSNMLTILVLALGLMVCPGSVCEAAPVGIAWTYQGWLMDANQPADGEYDFRFKLYDDANTVTGRQVGSTIDINDLDVIDGYFTVELDFGKDIFTGSARWLEIAVRPGASIFKYRTLSPRQEITPAPYAIYAKTSGGDGDWTVSGNNMYSIPSGNVGVGTTNPSAKLNVVGTFRGITSSSCGAAVYGNNTYSGSELCMPPYMSSGGLFSASGTHGAGVYGTASGGSGSGVYGYASSSSGTNRGVYGRTSSSDGYAGYFQGGKNYFEGNVGIGTTSPDGGLHIVGSGWPKSFVILDAGGGNYDAGIRLSNNGEPKHHIFNANDLGDALRIAPEGSYSSGGITLKQTGNVGIGTTSPGAKLDVTGADPNVIIRGTNTNSGDLINYGGHFTASGERGRGVYGEATHTGTYPFVPNYGGYFVAKSRKGIGVYGTVQNDLCEDGYCDPYGGYFEATSGGAGTGVYAEGAYTGVRGVGGDTGGSFVSTGTSGSWNFGVRATTNSSTGYAGYFVGGRNYFEGSVGIGTEDPGGYKLYVNGTAYSIGGWLSSDRQFKENIETIESPLEKIQSIKGISFEWKRSEYKEKGFPDGRHFGVIAQEVEEVLPEIVKEGPDGDKAVSYTELVPILTEAIKQQQKQIEDLQKEVARLKRFVK